jgi:serine/threonine-protein kinase RsbW
MSQHDLFTVFMSNCEQFQITIKNDTVAGQQVQERIVKILEDFEYPPRDVFSVRLALEEALVNAIKHGNGMDPTKSVQIECSISQDLARIEIEDEGEGFEPEEVPDPTDPANLERPCGRGLMLMRSFMSLIEFNESGNRVTLEKQREQASDNGDGDASEDESS